MTIIIAAVVALIAAFAGGAAYWFFFIHSAQQPVGFQATVHAAGPDMPKACRALLGSDDDMSTAFGVNVTAVDPGDRADTGVCIYQERGDDSRKHTVHVTFTGHGDAKHPAQAVSDDGRYRIYLDPDDSAAKDEKTVQRLSEIFVKATKRLYDDTDEWSAKLPSMQKDAVITTATIACSNGPCSTDSSSESYGNNVNESNGSTNGSNNSDANDDNSSSNSSSGTSSDTLAESTGTATTSGYKPTAYAYDTALELAGKPVAVKAQLDDGTTAWTKPADGQQLLLLDFRRAPSDMCATNVCSWSSKPSESASLTIGGKKIDDAGNVLDAVLSTNAQAHGVFVISTAADAKLELAVKSGGAEYTAELDPNADRNDLANAIEKARKALKDNVNKALNADKQRCAPGCTVTGAIEFTHPVWGRSAVVTFAAGKKYGTATGMPEVTLYDGSAGYAIVNQAGQIMYGNGGTSEVKPSRSASSNIIPAMERAGTTVGIAMTLFTRANDGELDMPIAWHTEPDGSMTNISPDTTADYADGTAACQVTVLAAGDLEKNGVPAWRFNADSCVSDQLTTERMWTWQSESGSEENEGSYTDSVVDAGEYTGKTNAWNIANVLMGTVYGFNSEKVIDLLSPDAKVYSFDSCTMKPYSQVKGFHTTSRDYSARDGQLLAFGFHFYWASKGDMFAPSKNEKFACNQIYTEGDIGGGIGGVFPGHTFTINQVNYDPKTRKAIVHVTERWDNSQFNRADTTNPNTLTITLDKQGRLLSATAERWGSSDNN